ncbi:hypothetical protein ACS0PU_010642 [Formica fusca]
MKSSLAFVLVLVLILGIIIPSGVIAADVSESTLQKSMLNEFFSDLERKITERLPELEKYIEYLKKLLLHVVATYDAFRVILEDYPLFIKAVMAKYDEIINH